MTDDGFLKYKPGFATAAAHVGQSQDRWKHDAVVPPIMLSTTYKQSAPAEHTGFIYSRVGNPTRSSLEECLAALDGGKHGFAFSSGLGAITTIALLLSNGDHLITIDDVYGGTNCLFREVITRLGIEVSFIDFTNLENLEKAIKANTKMIWMETPTNPTLKVIDIAETVKLAKSHGDIKVVVDNTFLTPYLQKPLNFGADIVMYSITKYMNGHSDVLMGAAVVNDQALADRLRLLQFTTGIVPSPFDCYLVSRSLKTLALRMEHHKKSSLVVAQWLEKHPKVTEVMHPGLESHKQHAIAKKQTAGHSSCFSFKHSGGLNETRKFLTALKIFTLAVSLGGYESLAEVPGLMSHSLVPETQQAELGITNALIRLAIGLEDVEDLIGDLEQAFNKAF